MALTYDSYLQLPTILNAQTPSQEHDETLFIIIHQTYELWFKQILHESQLLTSSLQHQDLMQASSTLRRMLIILKTLVGQVDVIETMSPRAFASFRPLLQTASGFQSIQFRMLETALGKRHRKTLELFADHPRYLELQALWERPSLYSMLLQVINDRGFSIPEQRLKSLEEPPQDADPMVEKGLLSAYQNSPELAQLCELFVDFDEGIQEWRYRHVKMVERTIGAKIGTGGSQGVAYLQQTLFCPTFRELWSLRQHF